jgi:hypothetical protein
MYRFAGIIYPQNGPDDTSLGKLRRGSAWLLSVLRFETKIARPTFPRIQLPPNLNPSPHLVCPSTSLSPGMPLIRRDSPEDQFLDRLLVLIQIQPIQFHD